MSTTTTPRPGRRALAGLLAGSGLALAGARPAAAAAAPPASPVPEATARDERVAELERLHGRTIAVHAFVPGTDRTLSHRPHERLPVLSVFKPLLAAHVLRDHPPTLLDERLRWSADDVVENSPVTSTTVRNGLTVAQLCEAAVTRSDNTAANVLLRRLGGPSLVTTFARSLGDTTTRLDRWEPDVNHAVPGDLRDTTSAAAIARTYAQLVLGRALGRQDRSLLTTWLLANQTTGTRFGAGVPAGWRLADKTGAGSYGTRNDVGVVWTPDGRPVVIAALTRADLPEAPGVDAALEDVAALACAVLGGR